MKRIYLLFALTSTVLVFAQQQEEEDDKLFENWFNEYENQPQYTAPPPPPNSVPLDGGLIGLIAAGGAMGYRKYKQKANKEG